MKKLLCIITEVSCQLPCFGITWCQATSRHLTFWQVTLWTSDLVDFLPLRSSDPLDSWPLWPLAFFPNWPYDSLPFVKLPFSQLTFWFLTFWCPNSPVRFPTLCQFTFLDFWPFANLPAFYCWVLTSTGNRLYLKIPSFISPLAQNPMLNIPLLKIPSGYKCPLGYKIPSLKIPSGTKFQSEACFT